jgi:cytochrome P450
MAIKATAPERRTSHEGDQEEPMAASLREDPYSSRILDNPYPVYKQIRDLGSAVWLPRRRLWAIGRFDDVRLALRSDKILTSGNGVAANQFVNDRRAPIVLTSDAEIHERRRGVLQRPILPSPLKALRPRLEAEAERLVSRLSNGEPFDAMSAFAAHLPVTVVAELVGLNEEGRDNMLRWAAATFNALGVMNCRGMRSIPTMLDLRKYVSRLDRSKLSPDGWAARLFEAADRGELSPVEARSMVIDYVAPALDTTILATGSMVWRLATTPGAFDALRADPSLIPSAVNEAVRLASPIRGFTRHAVSDFQIGDTTIPQAARVLILYASANRDERKYPEPDAFDVTRNPRDHVGWGHGPHTCVGMHLSRLEMEVLLGALVKQVAGIEVGEPRLLRNNVLQGFERLPTSFRRAPHHRAAAMPALAQ